MRLAADAIDESAPRWTGGQPIADVSGQRELHLATGTRLLWVRRTACRHRRPDPRRHEPYSTVNNATRSQRLRGLLRRAVRVRQTGSMAGDRAGIRHRFPTAARASSTCSRIAVTSSRASGHASSSARASRSQSGRRSPCIPGDGGDPGAPRRPLDATVAHDRCEGRRTCGPHGVGIASWTLGAHDPQPRRGSRPAHATVRGRRRRPRAMHFDRRSDVVLGRRGSRADSSECLSSRIAAAFSPRRASAIPPHASQERSVPVVRLELTGSRFPWRGTDRRRTPRLRQATPERVGVSRPSRIDEAPTIAASSIAMPSRLLTAAHHQARRAAHRRTRRPGRSPVPLHTRRARSGAPRLRPGDPGQTGSRRRCSPCMRRRPAFRHARPGSPARR